MPSQDWNTSPGTVFEAAGIPAGPINTIDKVFADPQVQHLGIATPIATPLFGDTRFVAHPLRTTLYCHLFPLLHDLGVPAARLARLWREIR